MNDQLKTANMKVSISPHIFSPRTTRGIMLDVIIALLPSLIAGTVIFGLRALAVTAVSVSVAFISEYIFNAICKKAQTAFDLSAIVTGLLLALNLPASVPLWQVAVGAFFAIIFVKCLFGGIGQNFANPAITARIFMLVSFGSLAKSAAPVITDAVAGATPLPIIMGTAEGARPPITDMLFGTYGGAIGETCTIAILIGGVYLIVRHVITWHTPVAFVGTLFIFTLIASGDIMTAVYHILAGGLMMGAFFMATDYATTPTTPSGQFVFGVGCGIITAVIRLWGAYPEGVSFAILFMNIVTPYIEKWTARKTFGGKKA